MFASPDTCLIWTETNKNANPATCGVTFAQLVMLKMAVSTARRATGNSQLDALKYLGDYNKNLMSNYNNMFFSIFNFGSYNILIK